MIGVFWQVILYVCVLHHVSVFCLHDPSAVTMQPTKDPGKDFEGMTSPPPKKMPRPQPDIATPDMQCGFEANTQGDDDVVVSSSEESQMAPLEKQREAVDILRNYFHPGQMQKAKLIDDVIQKDALVTKAPTAMKKMRVM